MGSSYSKPGAQAYEGLGKAASQGVKVLSHQDSITVQGAKFATFSVFCKCFSNQKNLLKVTTAVK